MEAEVDVSEILGLLEAANKDLAEAWRREKALQNELAELRNTIELYRNTLGVK